VGVSVEVGTGAGADAGKALIEVSCEVADLEGVEAAPGLAGSDGWSGERAPDNGVDGDKFDKASGLIVSSADGAVSLGVAGSFTGDGIVSALPAFARAWAIRSDVRVSVFLR
jgi:hypothetical protein